MHCVPSLTRVLRLQDNLLVIGATNEPENIAPKILTGRFERKVFVDNPNSSARRAMLTRQLSEEDHAHMLSAADIYVSNCPRGGSTFAWNVQNLRHGGPSFHGKEPGLCRQ